MKSDQVYLELRQIKLDAVNAEIGWYNGREDEAIRVMDDIWVRMKLIKDELVRREIE